MHKFGDLEYAYAGDMPRSPRILPVNTPVHVVQRGHNGCPVFREEPDYRLYLQCLQWAIEDNDCAVHAYTLMTNHVHLLLTPGQSGKLANVFMSIGRRYVQYFNEKYQRSGALWDSRYFSSCVQCEMQLMRCYRYIELNPVRAGIVVMPGAYRWSSYLCNAEGKTNPLIVPHEVYGRLGLNEMDRHSAYRALCNEPLSGRELTVIRRAWRCGKPLEST